MSNQLVGVLRGLLILTVLAGVLLGIAFLIDAYRKRRSPGPRPVKKLTRREVFWVTLIIIILFLLGMPVRNAFRPWRFSPQSTNTK